MLRLQKIAITGGVGSGKTTVCQYFQECGAFVVNADAIVHELLNSDTLLGQQIIRQFGLKVIKNGTLNRGMIAEEAFENPQQLEKLEKLLHPSVLHKIEELYTQASREGKYTSFVAEIPLLFEIKGESFYDCTVALLTDEKLARHRFEQAGFKKEDYDRRMRRQLSPHQKAVRAHYTIQNNGTLEDLKHKVFELNKVIMQQK